jgi:hypothetical protein
LRSLAIAAAAEHLTMAQKSAYYQKWQIHRRARPESFGARIDVHLNGRKTYDIHPAICCASTRIDGMGGWISRMGGTAFRVGLRQKPGALCRLDPHQSVALKDLHFRSDSIEGLRLGESVGIALLADQSRTYSEAFDGFLLRRLNGTRIRVSNGAVMPLPS